MIWMFIISRAFAEPCTEDLISQCNNGSTISCEVTCTADYVKTIEPSCSLYTQCPQSANTEKVRQATDKPFPKNNLVTQSNLEKAKETQERPPQEKINSTPNAPQPAAPMGTTNGKAQLKQSPETEAKPENQTSPLTLVSILLSILALGFVIQGFFAGKKRATQTQKMQEVLDRLEQQKKDNKNTCKNKLRI